MGGNPNAKDPKDRNPSHNCSQTKTYRQYNTSSFISSSEGLLEISFASTLDALLKRLTNDNSFKAAQYRTPSRLA